MKIKRAAKYGMWGIVAFDEAGYEWILNRTFPTDSPALAHTLDRIRASLEINPIHWRKRQRKQAYK